MGMVYRRNYCSGVDGRFGVGDSGVCGCGVVWRRGSSTCSSGDTIVERLLALSYIHVFINTILKIQ